MPPMETQISMHVSKMLLVKIQIRLRECAVWSESSLVAHVRRYVFWRFGSFGAECDNGCKLQGGFKPEENDSFSLTPFTFSYFKMEEMIKMSD